MFSLNSSIISLQTSIISIRELDKTGTRLKVSSLCNMLWMDLTFQHFNFVGITQTDTK